VSIIALLISILLPAIGVARENAQINTSKSNLRQIAIAHRAYAADWADRHVTLSRDTLGFHAGDVEAYNEAVYGGGAWFEGYPPIIAGRAHTPDHGYSNWGVWVNLDNRPHFQPINFPGAPNEEAWADAYGWFRFGHQAKPMQDYLNGRWHDPVFYPPRDRVVLESIKECFEVPGEFVAYPEICNPAWSGYCLSAAGLFNPAAFSLNAYTGEHWTPPWHLPSGYRVPSFGQVRYPTLKTHMLEHHWLQNMKAPCADAFEGCEPYYFNHSYQSMPVTLFYDGSVRMMCVLEPMSADRRHERQAGHGLWSRDTPFGEDGYLIADGYDFAAASFHILTIDGVLGRDALGRE
jgi:hypothetical protein